MKFYTKLIVFSLVLLLSSQLAKATHYRAGEIVYRQIAELRYEVTVITYTTANSPADKPFIDQFFWGDGTIDTIYRINGPLNGGFPSGEVVGNDIQKNVYRGIHTYPGVPPPPTRYYVIGALDPNRIDGINNIDNGNSVNVQFYVEDTIKFPTDLANIGFNNSPILLNPPIDYANVNDTFYHNPAAYDPDGDSLDFRLMVPLQAQSTNVPVYTYPDQWCPTNDAFVINRFTGEIIWAVPCQQGIFNIAILITEFRNGVIVGTMIRDMQIIVLSVPNDPPQIADIRDTCIRAGDTLIVPVTATDPQVLQTVTLTANGAPLEDLISPATFIATAGNPANGTFRWNTVCEHIRSQPYTTVFKAEDSYSIPGPGGPSKVPLVDLETWLVRVIAPPVENLTATASNNQVILNWQNPYECAGSPNFRGFTVWRKKGCDPFTPDYCETGLGGRGYTRLTPNRINTYTFTDNTIVVGEEYSYRVVAHFGKLSPNGLFEFDASESVASNEVCVIIPIDVPVILNADVRSTDIATGQVFVRWSKPLAGGLNLDTIITPPPYRFDVYRGNGFNFAAPALVQSYSANSYSALNDTTYLDTNLDTETTPWSYKILFFSNNDTVSATSVASTIFLSIQPSDQSLGLSWNFNVPWSNDSFAIFRLNKLTAQFDSIGVSYTNKYGDTNLQNDSTYCYFVKGYGHYSSLLLPRPLINHSQEACGVPIDTVAPCPPTLAVRNECSLYNEQPWETTSFINYLSWIYQVDSCSDDIKHLNIYYGENQNSLVFLDSTLSISDTTYNHQLPDNLAGCYAVTAVDRIGNESGFSNIVCIDNCPYYVLPNTFTPNGDGKNEKFHPYKPYRFVTRIEFRVFNRWGEEVFRTEDPEIGWDGTDQKTGKPLREGVYLYAGHYFEKRLNGEVRRPISGDKKGGGFIHLIRGK